MKNRKTLIILGLALIAALIALVFILNEEPEPDCCGENETMNQLLIKLEYS